MYGHRLVFLLSIVFFFFFTFSRLCRLCTILNQAAVPLPYTSLSSSIPISFYHSVCLVESCIRKNGKSGPIYK